MAPPLATRPFSSSTQPDVSSSPLLDVLVSFAHWRAAEPLSGAPGALHKQYTFRDAKTAARFVLQGACATGQPSRRADSLRHLRLRSPRRPTTAFLLARPRCAAAATDLRAKMRRADVRLDAPAAGGDAATVDVVVPATGRDRLVDADAGAASALDDVAAALQLAGRWG